MRYTLSFNCPKAFAIATLFASTLTTFTGCATTNNPRDPYEGFNRSMHSFNMGFDEYLLKPVADGYDFITPDFVQTRVSSFFGNLKGINVTINDLLQGKFEQGASDFGRFMTNTTIGMLGFFDVASDWGMQSHNEDFGQTLATWGMDSGPFLVLPLLGPTTPRDGFGSIFDRAANPSTYVPGTGVIETIDERRRLDPAIEASKESVDSYVFVREGYLQNRHFEIKDGNVDVDVLSEEALDSVTPSSAKKTSGSANGSSKTAGNNVLPRSQAYEQITREYQEISDKLDLLAEKRNARRHRHKRHNPR